MINEVVSEMLGLIKGFSVPLIAAAMASLATHYFTLRRELDKEKSSNFRHAKKMLYTVSLVRRSLMIIEDQLMAGYDGTKNRKVFYFDNRVISPSIRMDLVSDQGYDYLFTLGRVTVLDEYNRISISYGNYKKLFDLRSDLLDVLFSYLDEQTKETIFLGKYDENVFSKIDKLVPPGVHAEVLSSSKSLFENTQKIIGDCKKFEKKFSLAIKEIWPNESLAHWDVHTKKNA
jgi:hypothetical protein